MSPDDEHGEDPLDLPQLFSHGGFAVGPQELPDEDVRCGGGNESSSAKTHEVYLFHASDFLHHANRFQRHVIR